jgi:DNA recombination-dependent growth factor C
MNDKIIIAEIMEDMRKHSSAESVMRASLTAKVARMEKELNSCETDSLKDDCQITALRRAVSEFSRVLHQIAAPPSSGKHVLTREDCQRLAHEVLQQELKNEKTQIS